MPHFMLRWQFTDTSAKALVGKPHDRTGAATALVEGFGGKLHSYYISFGEYDGVGICEFPDNTAAAACSMGAAATGAFAGPSTPAAAASTARHVSADHYRIICTPNPVRLRG